MTTTTHSVHVANLAETTTEKNLSDFFTKLLHLLPVSDIDHGSPPDNFRITSIDFDSKAHAATVHFESPNAAKTALMLNGGTLDGSTISVTSDVEYEDLPHQEHHDETTPIQQTDKPRAAIAAEYLAKGYTLSDNILQKAIDLDQKQGISQRFLNYLRSFDRTLGEKLFGHKETPAGEQEKGTAGETSETGAAAGIARHPTVSGKAQETVAGIRDRAKAMDEEKGYSKQASSYYERAINSPLGQKVFAFYSSTSKQVLDIHEEAKRIAAETKQTATPESPGKAHPLGAILIGTFLNVWLYGILVTQVTLYYSVYKRDATWIKLLVAWIMLLDTLNSIFDMGFVYRYSITLFGDFPAQLHSHWFFHMVQPAIYTAPLMTVTIAATTQGFFAWRINRLTGSKWVSWAIALVLLVQFAAGAATTVGAWQVIDFTRFGELKAQISLWLVTSAIADVMITIVLTWYLHTHRTGFSKTEDLIARLIRLTVQTGLITTLWALVDLIMYLAVVTKPITPLIQSSTANSLLSTLNARGGWGDDSMQGSKNTTGGISIPMSIKMPRSHEHQAEVPRELEVSRTVEYEEGSFEMEDSSKSQVRGLKDIEQGGYSVHEIKHGGDRPLSSDVEHKF
ncbi:transmembrane protein [Rhizoctonia solani]|uniref:Transmembrane protein n=1 Tax=Rhizoctonia solani TaxID=456999 RepID=A0A8H8NV58_9AGAM|nr:uncharacterized protein RhiXN_09070 [Rhizoctonia solani]QRW20095.1 transmembrane protein [Rhizoctonia solani]